MIEINYYNTWPQKLKDYLEAQRSFFEKYCDDSISYKDSEPLARQYDRVVYNMKSILNSFKILGYHCTRLTVPEIESIKAVGMLIPSRQTLSLRIQNLRETGTVTPEIADLLNSVNDADGKSRSDIWFCLFPPHLTGESGIVSFFSMWGGETLFSSHENDIITGPVLRKIGIPSIVEASIPVEELRLIEEVFVKKFLSFIGLKSNINFDGHIATPLRSHNILNIIQHPSSRFIELTNCHKWDLQL